MQRKKCQQPRSTRRGEKKKSPPKPPHKNAAIRAKITPIFQPEGHKPLSHLHSQQNDAICNGTPFSITFSFILQQPKYTTIDTVLLIIVGKQRSPVFLIEHIPVRTPAPLWGQTTQIPSKWSSIVPKTRLQCYNRYTRYDTRYTINISTAGQWYP